MYGIAHATAANMVLAKTKYKVSDTPTVTILAVCIAVSFSIAEILKNSMAITPNRLSDISKYFRLVNIRLLPAAVPPKKYTNPQMIVITPKIPKSPNAKFLALVETLLKKSPPPLLCGCCGLCCVLMSIKNGLKTVKKR